MEDLHDKLSASSSISALGEFLSFLLYTTFPYLSNSLSYISPSSSSFTFCRMHHNLLYQRSTRKENVRKEEQSIISLWFTIGNLRYLYRTVTRSSRIFHIFLPHEQWQWKCFSFLNSTRENIFLILRRRRLNVLPGKSYPQLLSPKPKECAASGASS